MFTIYGYNTFNPEKAMLTAEELGIDYRYVKVELGRQEHKSPEHLARHPLGKVPVLEHDGHYIIESAAISRYLSRLNEHRLYATDPLQAAHIDGVMDMLICHVGPQAGTHFWQEVIRPGFFKEPTDTAMVDGAKLLLGSVLPALDAFLSDTEFLCGDEVTLADTTAFPYFRVQESTSMDISEYPHLMRWYKAFAARPSVQRLLDKLASQPTLLPSA